MSGLGNKNIMAKNIKKYMAINKVNQTDICKVLNIAPPTFSDWVNAKTYPRIDKIEMLANYFGIQKSDLIEETAENSEQDPDIRRIQRARKKMSQADKEKMMRMLETMFDECFRDDFKDDDDDD